MGFGKELKRLREAANITVNTLSVKSKIPKSRIDKWEQRDIERPKKEDEEKLQKLFGCKGMPKAYN